MPFFKSKEQIAALLGVGIVLAIILYAVISGYKDNAIPLDNAYKNIVEKKKILAQMRIHLSKSVEMEKNAVMATADEEAMDFAGQSRAAAAAVEQDLKTMGALVDAIPLQDEKKLMDEFTTCWAELGKLDQVILELAVENTNLKAASLSREKGAETIRKFEQALEKIIPAYADTPNANQVTGLICRALTAGLKMYNLHGPHIAEASDGNMDRIEARMRAEENEVAQSFAALDTIGGAESREAVSQAKAAFAEFMEVTSSVLKLSRQNSNVKSLELSLGRKRKTAAQCDEILATFQETVQSRTFKATR